MQNLTLDQAFGLAQQHHQANQLDQAEAIYRLMLQAVPEQSDALHYLGLALFQKGQHEAGLAMMRRGLALQPGSFTFAGNLGATLAQVGSWPEAIGYLETVVRLRPDFLEGQVNYASALMNLARYPEAIDRLLLIQQSAPENVSVLFQLGLAHHLLGRETVAMSYYQHLLTLDPHHADAWLKLGNALSVQGKPEEAIAAYRRAQEIRPDFPEALDFLVHERLSLCEWDGLTEQWARLLGIIESRPTSLWVRPFSLLPLPSSPEAQLLAARYWAANECGVPLKEAQHRPYMHRPRQRDRIRIGYASCDFFRHATSYLMAELLELHDRSRFEIYVYSWSRDDQSEIRQRVIEASDHFVEVKHLHYAQIAERIHADEIDLLIDLKGYTTDPRSEIFALRPAPVQAQWLGYPGTMGCSFIDYLIADPYVVPSELERFYDEKIVRLPNCYQCNDRKRPIREPGPTRAEAGLPKTGLVLCCFNQLYKILPDVFALWMRVLQALPGSVLWLLGQKSKAVQNLQREAARLGVDPARLIFANKIPLADHLARYRLADFAIDTFPYTSHTTASDALWAGCPLATCVGQTFASRVAGSVLTNAGVPELIAPSLAEYEGLILRLARDEPRRRELRQRLSATRSACPLFDAPRFTRDLESAFLRMVYPR